MREDGIVADRSGAIDLSLGEIRQMTVWAVASTRPALMIFERIRSDDPRARNALDAASAFAQGTKRTKLLVGSAESVQSSSPVSREPLLDPSTPSSR
jgi:hypothetical protein